MVERALGVIPGACNVGETIDLFRRVIDGDERCGCGEPFSTCPFWSAVTARSVSLRDPVRRRRMTELQNAVIRQRYFPRMLATRRYEDGFGAMLAAYAAGYADIYAAIDLVASPSFIIDASKWPVQALALSVGEIDLRVVHLVRDPRGVAYSSSKTNVPRPHMTDGQDTMARRPVLVAAAQWTVTQTQVDLLRQRGIRTATLRYEDFVADPGASLGACLTALGLADAAQHAPGSTTLDLPASHGLSGNPSRFQLGPVRLRSDEAWREGLSAPSRVAVTALAAPMLLRPALRRAAALAPSTDAALRAAPVPVPDHWPGVAVVVPTRGRPDLVRETLRSIVAQDYQGEMDIVVVHDQEPEDQSLVELGAPNRPIRVISNERPQGLAGARNTGLAVTSAPLVASCDDDDQWHPEKLTAQVRMLSEDPDVLVMGSGIRLMLPGDVVTDWPARGDRISRETLLRNRVKELHSSTLLIRREVFAKAGEYDESLPHGYAEDYDWVLRASAVGAIGCVVRPLADINKRVQSWYQGRSNNTLDALIVFQERHPEIRTSRRGYARLLGQQAFIESTMGKRRTALGHAVQGLAQWPATPHVALAFAHLATGIEPQRFLQLARRFGRGLS